jgi:hypothetical protein
MRDSDAAAQGGPRIEVARNIAKRSHDIPPACGRRAAPGQCAVQKQNQTKWGELTYHYKQGISRRVREAVWAGLLSCLLRNRTTVRADLRENPHKTTDAGPGTARRGEAVVGLGTGVLRLYGSISGLPHCGGAYRGGVRIDRCISAQNSEE